MPAPFELALYFRALQGRWKRIAATVALAAAIALVVSLLLPPKYDATVLLVIQPGASNAPYPAAMNPVYLEYLRSYEQFLQSDGLLARLLREARLDQAPYGFTVEKFRRSALRAAVVKNTKILKITVRLAAPQKAHEVALLLARLASQSNAEMNSAEAERARQQIRKELEEARARLETTRAALEKFRRESREDEVSRQVTRQIERKLGYQDQLNDVQISLAEQEARLAALSAEWDRERTRAELEGLRARHKALRAAFADVEATVARNQAARASLEVRRQELERDYDLAQNTLETYTKRGNESGLALAARHEELQIADPGVVPAQPSSPHLLLNVLLAAFLGLLGSVLYETWAWNWNQEQRAFAALVGSGSSGGRTV